VSFFTRLRVAKAPYGLYKGIYVDFWSILINSSVPFLSDHLVDSTKQAWIDSTFEAIASCERYLTLQDAGAGEFKTLANWIYFADQNPYGFMPVGWESAKGTAQGFKSFLDALHRAVLNEGNWCFVEPQIHSSFLVLGLDTHEAEKIQAIVDKKIGLPYRRPFEVHQDVARFIKHVSNH